MKLSAFERINLDVDFCVVGGGMAGICAAVAAARHGAKTLLVQDRPVLGGNASSEIRMSIGGARKPNMKETGILEEIQLENLRYNPTMRYDIWDHILIQFVQRQPNMTLLLNCTCHDVEMDGTRIAAIQAWQMTTQRKIRISAKYFADCSGDSVLRISGAEYRMGREAKKEFDEFNAPDVADDKTMGNSILLQTKETDVDRHFEVPEWAYRFKFGKDKDKHPVLINKSAQRTLWARDNYWWLEYGGERNTISDAEEIRDELLKIVHGAWDTVKNQSGLAKGMDLEWLGALPGKRESVRYVGDHILTEGDIEKQGKFDDIVAYGGWSMDDHNPAAFYHDGPPTIFHPAPSPYGIPFRCLYSKNIDNLYFAGRNISCTHMALSSTRVMGTCSILGQAVGTAAAISVAKQLNPRQVYEQEIGLLQLLLMEDDCWLPWHVRAISKLTKNASLTSADGQNADVLRNGIDRTVGLDANCLETEFENAITYQFNKPEIVSSVRLVLDSNLHDVDYKAMPCFYPKDNAERNIPETLLANFAIEVKRSANDDWQEVFSAEDNYQRLLYIPINRKCVAVRLIPFGTWGSGKARIFSFEVR